MKLLQFIDVGGQRRVAVSDANERERAVVVEGFGSIYALAREALDRKIGIRHLINTSLSSVEVEIEGLLGSGRLLVPIDHPDRRRCMVSGTGLTHRGSAVARDEMVHGARGGLPLKSDSMQMYVWGSERGRPADGEVGVEPEWFYKGDGNCLVPAGQQLCKPHYAEDSGEEPELAGVYVIADDGQPHRIGFVMANDFSDHRLEERSYLYVASSKLRSCAVSPQLIIGEPPHEINGMSRIYREGAVLWERPIRTGEANMCHSIRNLEWHHFKHRQFRQPGDLHIHLFGTPVMSYSDGIAKMQGDVFEIDVPAFGPPMRNTLVFETANEFAGCRVL